MINTTTEALIKLISSLGICECGFLKRKRTFRMGPCSFFDLDPRLRLC